MALTKTQSREGLDAYEQRSVPAQADGSLNDRFWALITARLAQSVSRSDHLVLQWARAQLRSALTAARRREMQTAWTYLEEVRSAHFDVIPVAAALITSTTDSAAAYLHYQQAEFAFALAALDRARQCDSMIETELDLVEWRLHQATVASNVAHIYARQGDFVAGLNQLAGVVLGFIAAPSTSRTCYCDEALAAAVPSDLLAEMAWAFAGETAVILANVEPAELPSACAAVRPVAVLPPTGTSRDDIVRVFSLLVDLIEHSARPAIEASRLLSIIPVNAIQAWQAACGILALYGKGATAALRSRVIRDAAHWPTRGTLVERMLERLRAADRQRA